MFDFAHRRALRKLQQRREKFDTESSVELKGARGEIRQELLAEWGFEYGVLDEEINMLLSDHSRKQAERYDVALPKREEGDHWERMRYQGDRLILTTLGREVTREKIVKEKKNAREARAFILSLIATVGSLSIAALAIFLKK